MLSEKGSEEEAFAMFTEKEDSEQNKLATLSERGYEKDLINLT